MNPFQTNVKRRYAKSCTADHCPVPYVLSCYTVSHVKNTPLMHNLIITPLSCQLRTIIKSIIHQRTKRKLNSSCPPVQQRPVSVSPPCCGDLEPPAVLGKCHTHPRQGPFTLQLLHYGFRSPKLYPKRCMLEHIRPQSGAKECLVNCHSTNGSPAAASNTE